mgnify:CR=1 FL=1
MKIALRSGIPFAAFVAVMAASTAAAQTDPLPSWNEGPSRASILRFLDAVTAEGSADFVPPLDRIAVFDNDGTLWIEKPLYIPVEYEINHIKRITCRSRFIYLKKFIRIRRNRMSFKKSIYDTNNEPYGDFYS